MKVCLPQVQAGHLFVGHFDSFRVRVDIEIRVDGQALAGFRMGNEVHDHLQTFLPSVPVPPAPSSTAADFLVCRLVNRFRAPLGSPFLQGLPICFIAR